MPEHEPATGGPWAHLTSTATRTPGTTAVRDASTAVTYRELVTRAEDLAARLHRLGVRRGDRVVMTTPASVEAAVTLYAIWRIGGVAVPLHPDTTPERLAGIVADSAATAVLGDADAAHRLPTGTAAGERVTAGDGVGTEIVGGEIVAVIVELPAAGHGPADLVCLIYTSGSSAAPKGVRCPASVVSAALAGIQDRLGYRADDVVCLASPLSFDYGLYQLLLAVHCGAELVVAPPSNPAAITALLREERITVLPLVPTIAAILIALLPRRGPVTSVRFITSTGAALSDERMRALRGVFPAAGVVAMYGITECKRVSIAEPDVELVRPGTVGLPLAGTRVTIEGPDGTELPPGSIGEIVVHGPHVMDGYWGDPERTAAVFGVSADGVPYLRTGDYGHVDAAGHLAIEGRRDDVFKVRGNRTSAAEVAAAAAGLPGLIDLVVVPPVDDANYAVVVTGAVTPDDVLAALARTIEPQRMPADCVVVAAMPTTPNGKLDIRAVQRRYREGALR